MSLTRIPMSTPFFPSFSHSFTFKLPLTNTFLPFFKYFSNTSLYAIVHDTHFVDSIFSFFSFLRLSVTPILNDKNLLPIHSTLVESLPRLPIQVNSNIMINFFH